MYPQCTTASTKANRVSRALFAPTSEVKRLSGIRTDSDEPVLLCSAHYCQVYRQVHPPMKCASCGAFPKPGSKFTHHSPDASLVSRYLHEIDHMVEEIQPNDNLCMTCYKVHLSVVSVIEASDATSFVTSLISDISLWLLAKESNTNTLTKSILEIVIFVSKHLLDDKALLLTTASMIFLEAYTGQRDIDSVSSVALELEIGNSTIKFSSRWLLNQLIFHLHKYMTCKSVHRKYGTIIIVQKGRRPFG